MFQFDIGERCDGKFNVWRRQRGKYGFGDWTIVRVVNKTVAENILKHLAKG